jgi:ribosome-binding protein aMBF1 (putative translation factor)
MRLETIEKNGTTYAMVPLHAWEKLLSGDVAMPSLPEADENGDRPALPFMRAIIARGIIRDRVAAGLSQAELARRAGMEPATLNRIEKAKVTPDEATITKIDKALEKAASARKVRSHAVAGSKTATPRAHVVGRPVKLKTRPTSI